MERIEKTDLQGSIIWQIKNHIYKNRLQPGNLLPSQAVMATTIGASRASIREAIKTMEAQGLVRTINGKGIYVEHVDTSFYEGPMDNAYIMKLLIDALNVRKALEGMAVELCTLLATDEQLRSLSQLLEKVESRYYKKEYQADVDLLFHQTLIALADNKLLSHMLKNLMQHSSGMWKMESSVADILSDSIPGHRIMMDCILARDAAGAVAAYRRYMENTVVALSTIAV